ncbi:MAG: ribosome recycling factor [Gammaproteobacteria bacterium]|nr:ribosome recycling factor [Gammaproteobacteria bacterium]
MMNQIKQDAEKKMQKSLESLKHEFSKIRTGRANTSLLDHIMVDYYGNLTPLSQVANVTASDARTLTVTPWEKTMVAAIEKAISTSDLGLNPMTSGQAIRVPLPSLTEERRKELIKVVKGEAEQGRVAVRNTRRDANHQLKEAVKAKTLTEDDERRGTEWVQKLTDKYIADIEVLLEEKEKDLMEV